MSSKSTLFQKYGRVIFSIITIFFHALFLSYLGPLPGLQHNLESDNFTALLVVQLFLIIAFVVIEK